MMNRRFHELGVDVERPYQLLYSEGLTKKYEAGLMTTDDFCTQVRQTLHTSISDGLILDAWNTLVADFPSRHIGLMKKLKKYALNLNQIMIFHH